MTDYLPILRLVVETMAFNSLWIRTLSFHCILLPHPSSPNRRGSSFSKTPPSPLNLKRGSTSLQNPPLATPKSFTLGNDQMNLSLLSLNQDFISGVEDLKPGRPGLYEQTSFNCVDFRLRSAEHSSELDALLSLARKFATKGLLVVIYATELRLFNAHSASVYAP